MKKLFAALLLLTFTLSSFANCRSEYEKKINEISGKMNPPRTTVISNIGAEAVVVTTLASAGVLTVASAVALPAAALGAGSYLIYLGHQKKLMIDSMLTLDQSRKMKGKHWEKFLKKVLKKVPDQDPQVIADVLARLDSENAFCPLNAEKGRVELMKPKAMRQLVVAEIENY